MKISINDQVISEPLAVKAWAEKRTIYASFKILNRNRRTIKGSGNKIEWLCTSLGKY
jgi:hypothetical protein